MDHSRDEGLIVELQTALATIDPVPADVIAAAKASFSWRSVDDELAELIADSATAPLAGARSVSDPEESRLLTFEGPGLTVEIEVTAQGDMRRLVGQLIPPRRAEVEVRWSGGAVTSEADEIGLFAAGSVPAGPVSIVCRPPDAERQVVTSWVTV